MRSICHDTSFYRGVIHDGLWAPTLIKREEITSLVADLLSVRFTKNHTEYFLVTMDSLKIVTTLEEMNPWQLT